MYRLKKDLSRQLRVMQMQMLQALARGDLADAERCITPVMDRDQHMRQTEGWQESWDAVKAGMDLHGPFDGIMGFSQVCRPALAQSTSFEGQPHGAERPPCASECGSAKP